MHLGLSLGIGHRSASGAYNPQAALFASSEQGAWYDPSDLSTVWADTSGTTPATVGGAVARIDDKSGNGNHATQATAAARPILRQDGELYYLEFDGVDDSLATASIDFSATDEMTVIAGVRKLSDANACIAEVSTNGTSVNSSFVLQVWDVGRYGAASRGTIAANAIPATNTYPVPLTNVLTGQGDISADNVVLRANGSVAASSATDQGTGNYGAAYPLYIGRRAGTTLPFNGHLYGLILRGKTTAGTDLTNAEAYVADKTGVSL